MKEFNVNDTIKVKLTAHGKNIHWKDHVDTWTRLGRLKDFPYTPPKEDANGFCSFQLWSFMELFGPHFGMTLPQVIEGNNIYFPEHENG